MNHFDFTMEATHPSIDKSQFQPLDTKFTTQQNTRPFFIINKTGAVAIIALRFVWDMGNSPWYAVQPPIGQTCNPVMDDCLAQKKWQLLCYLPVDNLYNMQLALIDSQQKVYVATGYKIFISSQMPGGYTVFPLEGGGIVGG